MSESAIETPQPALVQLPDIIQRYSNGEPVESICRDYHVSRYTIYNWMLAGLGDQQYEQVVTKCLVRGIADADKALEDSEDALTFNKAHARARLLRQDFERRRPKLYGPKQEVAHDSRITVIVQRDRPQPVVVGGQTVDVQPVSAQNDSERSA